MIRAAALALSLAAAPLAAAVPKAQPRIGATAILTPQAFREAVAAAVGRLRPSAMIKRTGDQELTFSDAGGNEIKVYTGNAYDAYRSDPDSMTTIVERYAAAVSGVNDADSAKLEQLVVIVRPANYFGAAFAPGAGPGVLLAPRPMAGDLAYFLAVDSPETVRTATTDDLARWEISEAEAWVRATANIKTRLGEVGIGALPDDEGGAIGVNAASGLAPSLLADPRVCGPDHPSGLERQIVFLANRELYLFGNPGDAVLMKAFWRTVKSMLAAGSPFSATPLTCRDGRWVVVPIP